MSAEQSCSRHLVSVGELYFQWDRGGRHHLAVDLAGPLPEWVVLVDGGPVPLSEYLGRHPGRREEVRQLIRRLAGPELGGRPNTGPTVTRSVEG